MAKRCRISLEARGKIVEGHTQRHNNTARIGCSQQGVCKVLKRTSVVNKIFLEGKEKHEDRLIVRKSKSNQFKTIPGIKTEVKEEDEISNSTIQRRLREAGLFGLNPRKNPYLSQTSSVKLCYCKR